MVLHTQLVPLIFGRMEVDEFNLAAPLAYLFRLVIEVIVNPKRYRRIGLHIFPFTSQIYVVINDLLLFGRKVLQIRCPHSTQRIKKQNRQKYKWALAVLLGE